MAACRAGISHIVKDQSVELGSRHHHGTLRCDLRLPLRGLVAIPRSSDQFRLTSLHRGHGRNLIGQPLGRESLVCGNCSLEAEHLQLGVLRLVEPHVLERVILDGHIPIEERTSQAGPKFLNAPPSLRLGSVQEWSDILIRYSRNAGLAELDDLERLTPRVVPVRGQGFAESGALVGGQEQFAVEDGDEVADGGLLGFGVPSLDLRLVARLLLGGKMLLHRSGHAVLDLLARIRGRRLVTKRGLSTLRSLPGDIVRGCVSERLCSFATDGFSLVFCQIASGPYQEQFRSQERQEVPGERGGFGLACGGAARIRQLLRWRIHGLRYLGEDGSGCEDRGHHAADHQGADKRPGSVVSHGMRTPAGRPRRRLSDVHDSGEGHPRGYRAATLIAPRSNPRRRRHEGEGVGD